MIFNIFQPPTLKSQLIQMPAALLLSACGNCKLPVLSCNRPKTPVHSHLFSKVINPRTSPFTAVILMINSSLDIFCIFMVNHDFEIQHAHTYFEIPNDDELGFWHCVCVCVCRPGSSVGIATEYGPDGPRIESRWDEIFRPSRPVLGPTQPPAQLIPGLSRGKVRPGRAADHSPPSSAVVMQE